MTNSETIVDYDAYLGSDQWRTRAREIRERDGLTCQVCGATDVPLEVHHLTYDRLGHESDEDLLTVCHSCHEAISRSWRSMRDEIKARNRALRMPRKYMYAAEVAQYLNALMPLDISFDGRYVMTRLEDINAACDAVGLEPAHVMSIREKFGAIHVFDVATKLANGTPRWALKRQGYPSSLVNGIEERKQVRDGALRNVSDEAVCFMHEGKGKWIVTAIEDGLDTTFRLRFMPYIRYANAWWEL